MVYGLGFGAWGLGFEGLEFRVQSSKLMVQDLVQGLFFGSEG